MKTLSCPALLIAAPGSGTGKTTFTAGLARHHRNLGRRVRVFKMGPDFLDPLVLEQASGSPVHSLDLWMVGETRCQALLYQAAQEADLILIEGAMGLYDGKPSAADLAQRFTVPVLGLLDAKGQAQTFGALAYGLAYYRPGLPFAGVAANHVGSPHHDSLLAESLPEGLRYLGGLPRDTSLILPERHLGLAVATEIEDLDSRIERCAKLIAETQLRELPAPVAFKAPALSDMNPVEDNVLNGKRIGVARDAAFAFIYQANLDVLAALGAEIQYFSPLSDTGLPDVDAVYLPGGYPELHLRALSENKGMRTALHSHYAANKPIYAECGGMLYLLETLETKNKEIAPMLCLLPGRAIMQERLAALGLQALEAPQKDSHSESNGIAHNDSTLHKEIRGHTFHYSTATISETPWAVARRQRGAAPGEAVYKKGPITATYLHLYFPSNPRLAASFFCPDVGS